MDDPDISLQLSCIHQPSALRRKSQWLHHLEKPVIQKRTAQGWLSSWSSWKAKVDEFHIGIIYYHMALEKPGIKCAISIINRPQEAKSDSKEDEGNKISSNCPSFWWFGWDTQRGKLRAATTFFQANCRESAHLLWSRYHPLGPLRPCSRTPCRLFQWFCPDPSEFAQRSRKPITTLKLRKVSMLNSKSPKLGSWWKPNATCWRVIAILWLLPLPLDLHDSWNIRKRSKTRLFQSHLERTFWMVLQISSSSSFNASPWRSINFPEVLQRFQFRGSKICSEMLQNSKHVLRMSWELHQSLVGDPLARVLTDSWKFCLIGSCATP